MSHTFLWVVFYCAGDVTIKSNSACIISVSLDMRVFCFITAEEH